MLKKFIDRNKSKLKKARVIASISLVVGLIFTWFIFFHEENDPNYLTFGVVSDIHASAKHNPSIDNVETKKYSETLPYFVSEMKKLGVEFSIELGDYINGTDRNIEQGTKDFNLVNDIFSKIKKRYYVLGNHDVIALTKDEFINLSGMPANYYSFEKKGYRFIVLDAQFNPEGKDMGPGIKKHIPGYIPEAEKDWLKKELEGTDKPAIIFSHQPLFSVDPNNEKLSWITNADEIKNILADRKDKILGFFSGHNHRPAIREVDGINYIFVPSMAQEEYTGSYAVVEITENNIMVNFLSPSGKINPLP
jgi:alkaline phosphatase